MDDHESTRAKQLAPAGSSFLFINGCRQYLCISGMSAPTVHRFTGSLLVKSPHFQTDRNRYKLQAKEVATRDATRHFHVQALPSSCVHSPTN